ncbi:MAG: universal stress protein, partial [Rhodospirillaceae bacterium]
LTSPMFDEFYGSLQKAREQKRHAARRHFDEAVAQTKTPIATRPLCAQATTEWLDGVAGDGDPVGAIGPLADLAVINAPGNRRTGDWKVVEDVVFGVGRPALIVPPGCTDVSFKRPLIAWNGSAQAANAMRGALDLFENDGPITVLQVGGLRPGGISAERAADSLGWHCFEAACRCVPDAPHQTGAIILEQAKALSSTVIVLGAYGHSRTRELIFGGVTDYLLRHSTIPLLFAH